MVIIFIVILAIGAALAIWFNVWNIRNPVGGKKQEYTMENLQYINRQNNQQYKEQNERILKMMNNRSAVV